MSKPNPPAKSTSTRRSSSRKGKQNELLFVCGHKGYGKSKLVKDRVERATGRVLIWDPLDEYHPRGRRASDPIRCPASRYAGDQNRNGWAHFLEDTRAGHRPRVAAVWAPDDAFDSACRFVYETGNTLFVIEEADLFCNPGSLPKPLRNLIRRGRHAGVDLVFVTRAPSEVHRDVTRQADAEVYFGLEEWLDLEWLRKRAGNEWVDKVRALRPHEWVERRR